VLIAGGQHVMSLASHEFSHFAVFPQNRRLNDWVGDWLYSAPIALPLAVFRHRHFAHHRLYSRHDDTKEVYRDSLVGRGLWIELGRAACGLDYLARVLRAVKRSREEARRGLETPDTGRASLPTLVMQAVLLGLFWLIDPWLYFTLWLLPLVTLTQVFHKLRATVEHQPLESEAWGAKDSGYFMDTPGPYVRSLRGSALERFFLAAMNFGYHAEHHLWPQVSYQYLPLVRERLLVAGAFDDPRFALEETYLGVVTKLWRGEAGASEIVAEL
jgi:fatty acid desaturase